MTERIIPQPIISEPAAGEPVTTSWDPEKDLTRLLDELTDELMAAPDHEVMPYSEEINGAHHDQADAVRRVIAAADGEFVVLPVSSFIAPGLRTLTTRN